MLDPIISLAFSMQSNKGVYALLLGSGVSRSSRIPTGWEIVLELVRKVALLENADCEPDPAAWYVDRFGRQPDYGELLDAVARTPDERQALLRNYFEPTAQEREDGAKMPTKAHRAIAKLVRAGYVRVIVTTNFDRLTERALEDEGISPIVVSGPDQLAGLPPFAHLGCCVVKVHGDYLDVRIRNTPTELEAYTHEMNRFLDRVFDEFGLVTCGWSADWDTGLRASIERAPSRRYSMYWASRGTPGQTAHDLIARRSGRVLSINDADSFFDDLHSKIESIEEFNKPHPLSKDIAVASAKRFLSDAQHRIRFSDLIDGLSRDLAAKLRDGPFSDTNSMPDVKSVTARVRTYDSLCSTLTGVAMVIGRWGTRDSAHALRRARERIEAVRKQDGYVTWTCYQHYPTTLLTYAALLGAFLSNNLLAMGPLFDGEVRLRGYDTPVPEALPPSLFVADEGERLLEGFERHKVPVSFWMHRTLWTELGREFSSQSEFDINFDSVEIVASLACQHIRAQREEGDFGRWFPPGRYVTNAKSRGLAFRKIDESLESDGDKSPYVALKLFGSNVKDSKAAVSALSSPFAKSLFR
ncbi:SIR2 family protein [Caballeronia sp. ATUFL_M2_KS44]|uniref:SIR2 family protein n=1 Tax=Caballeronia sp. ATUFL_M2_KS44 TaxID=2921767 RepID=UPI0020296E16|nr:SIR2 family protein [Caballeronia sp. ATUFL_M2_KS44]